MSNVKFNSDGRITGVHGRHDMKNVRGWETGTTAIGGNVALRLGHAQGVASYDDNTLSIEEPFRTGRFLCIWTKLPTFLHPTAQAYWRYFMQDRVLEFSGLNDNEIGTMERTTGAVGRSEAYAGYYKENNNGFSIKVPEYKGLPMRKLSKYYLSGISDPATGIAHFHGNKDLRFSTRNYGGDMFYILLGPSGRPDDIEFACAYIDAFMVKDHISHLNSGTIGEPGDAGLTYDLEFKGKYVQNNAVNRMAIDIVEKVGLYKDTVEDVNLPTYLYRDYGSGISDKLGKTFGIDMATRLRNAAGYSGNGDIPSDQTGADLLQGTIDGRKVLDTNTNRDFTLGTSLQNDSVKFNPLSPD